MARRVFFCFHYQPDVHRAHVVRNSWVTKADREDAGIFDASVFESKKRSSDEGSEALPEGWACRLVGNECSDRRPDRLAPLGVLRAAAQLC